jgi:hypothetical protein
MTEPENHTLALLREMRAAIDHGFEKLSAEVAAIKAETAHIPAIAEEVAALGVQTAEIRESVAIIEHDLTGLKMRVDRIERERRQGLPQQ